MSKVESKENKVNLKEIYSDPEGIKKFELGEDAKKSTVGLALSGGGIRSASFALGVVQAFIWKGKKGQKEEENIKPFAEQFQYLSTVSGGGYLGSALTWLKSLGLDLNEQLDSKSAGARNRKENNWLDYVRQHGNFLKPNSISSLGLVSVFLRNILMAFFVYFSMLVILFYFANKFNMLTSHQMLGFLGVAWELNYISLMFIVAICLYLALLTFYSIASYIGSFTPKDKYKSKTVIKRWFNQHYKFRLSIQKHAGKLLGFIITTGLISLIPYIYYLIEKRPGDIGSLTLSSTAGGAGVLGAIYQFFKGRGVSVIRSFSANIRIILSAALLIFGLLLGAYAIVCQHYGFLGENILIIIAVVMLIGLLTNLNYFGITRMYRDRLMETFMPDKEAVSTGNWQPAFDADITSLSKLQAIRPYHIINANIVLVDCHSDKFRGRGGDSFIMSPKSCGSEATGYVETDKWLGDRMNLPTAVAISGAALNPNSGVSGRGISKNRLVSFLLAFLQIRLGYWATNPKICNGDKRRIITKIFKPNYLFPGIYQGLLGKGLDDNATWTELTDGGHFDNTGVYELIRRKADVIVLSMAGADPEYKFSDLANLMQKVRVDFGVFIDLNDDDLRPLIPTRSATSSNKATGFVTAKIKYADGTRGKLIIIATTAITAMPADVFSYKKEHPLFPHEPTSDQFYDEQQLEAYRELGFHIARECINDNKILRG